MKQKLKNKVVVITGASSGIGEALARLFAKEGACVVLAARNFQKLQAITDEITKEGGHAYPVQTNVAVQADCDNLIQQAVARYNKIDILINNAGISMRALFREVDLNVLKELMDINFWGTVYCTRYAMPFLETTKGTVVGMSSIAGWRGLPGRTGYSASKFAMQGFLEALRAENIKTGVQVLTMCPGFTQSNIRVTARNETGTAQGESPRDEGSMMTAEEVAIHTLNAILAKKKVVILTPLGRMTVFMNKWFSGWMDKVTWKHFAKETDSPLK